MTEMHILLHFVLVAHVISFAHGNVVEFEHTDGYHLAALAMEYKENFRLTEHLSIEQQNTLFENIKQINAHNANPSKTYTMEVNRFSHMTDQEFNLQMLSANQDCSATTANMRSSKLPFSHYDKLFNVATMPEFKNWAVEGNYVTPVKNQGHCGSCWTFSSTGCLESAWAVHRGELVSLSEQQLIDCAGDFDNHGCSGGLPSHAFEYVHQQGGMDTEEGYAYKAKELGKCAYDKAATAPIIVQGSFNVTEGDEDTLLESVAYFNPVSIAYQVVKDFRNYKNGVYSSADCKSGPMDVNHAVLAVGYGTTSAGEKYWIIKNSWGADWGNGGYFWMKRGENMCGIATCASFPVVQKSEDGENKNGNNNDIE